MPNSLTAQPAAAAPVFAPQPQAAPVGAPQPAASARPSATTPARAAETAPSNSTPADSPPSAELPEELVAARAYEIWQQRGCPMGQDSADWYAAREELEQQRLGFAAPTPEDRDRGER